MKFSSVLPKLKGTMFLGLPLLAWYPGPSADVMEKGLVTLGYSQQSDFG